MWCTTSYELWISQPHKCLCKIYTTCKKCFAILIPYVVYPLMSLSLIFAWWFLWGTRSFPWLVHIRYFFFILLLVLVEQQQCVLFLFHSFWWFLCDSNKTFYCLHIWRLHLYLQLWIFSVTVKSLSWIFHILSPMIC